MLLNERTSLESFIIKPPAHCMSSDVALIQIFITEYIAICDRPVYLAGSQKHFLWLATRKNTSKTIAYRWSFVFQIKTFINAANRKTSFVKINCIT